MATELTVGADGGSYDYSDIDNALAFASTVSDDVDILVGKNTGGGLVWSRSSNVVVPAMTAATTYALRIIGTEGSLLDGGQIEFAFDSGATRGFDYNSVGYAYRYATKNLKVTANGNCVWLYRVLTHSIIECDFKNTGAGQILIVCGGAGPNIINSVIDSVAGYAVYMTTGSFANVINSLVHGYFSVCDRPAGSGKVINSTLISDVNPVIYNKAYHVQNSILVALGSNLFTTAVATHEAQNMLYDNNLLYSSTGNYYTGKTIASLTTDYPDQFTDILDDNPLFTATGDLRNYATLTSASPALGANLGARTNKLYAGLSQYPMDLGAYSDYAEISPDDIIDTAGGNWIVSTLTESIVKLATLFGLTSEGSYAPDFPIVEDVFLGIEYDDGNLTGTFAPYAATEQIGNLVLPTAEQIELGVPSDSNGGVLGTYDPTVTPDAPVLTAIHTGNGEFTVDFTTTLPTDTVQIQYAKTSTEDWTIDSQTHVGSGSITVTTGVENNGQEYIATAIVDNGGCISLSSNKGYVTPMDPNSLLNEIVRYRIEKQSDGEGGYIDILANPLVIYPTLRYDEVEPTATIHVEADIQAEDIISVFDENYYRVTNTRRNTNGLYKNLVLVKIERPVGAAPSQ